MDDAAPITNLAKRKVAKRELDFRRYVYPKRIAEGRMKPADAEHEIAIMTAIHQDYVRLAAEDEEIAKVAARKADLFG